MLLHDGGEPLESILCLRSSVASSIFDAHTHKRTNHISRWCQFMPQFFRRAKRTNHSVKQVRIGLKVVLTCIALTCLDHLHSSFWKATFIVQFATICGSSASCHCSRVTLRLYGTSWTFWLIGCDGHCCSCTSNKSWICFSAPGEATSRSAPTSCIE